VPGTVQVTLRIFDSSGLELRNIAAGMATAPLTSAFKVSVDPYDPSVGGLVLSEGAWSYSFDGRDSHGEVLPNGAYVFELESNQGGTVTKVRRTLQVVGSGVPMVEVLAGPNPLRPGALQVIIQWKPSVPVDLKIYNLNGELVRELGRVVGGPVDWDLRTQTGVPVGNGVYWISARRPGERLPRLFKLMLAR
jgi:hypothetical protein